jgi:anti-sigma-K factor RskA
MNLSDPRLLNRLAAEYVLGTLTGRARRRFERVLASTADARSAVEEWEQRLLPLALRLPPVAPRPATWQRIRLRIGMPSQRVPKSGWRRAATPLALAAAVAVLAIGMLLWVRNEAPQFRTAATVVTTDGRPLWRVELAEHADQIRIAVTGVVETPSGKDFELWALPEKGAPVSLGLLPSQGQVQRPLAARQRQALATARQVAVSIEPRGGSPTGAPTGAVVHVAPLTLASIAIPGASSRS